MRGSKDAAGRSPVDHSSLPRRAGRDHADGRRGTGHDEDEVGASPDADVEDEVGEETHADDEPLVDEPLDDAGLALLEQIDERIRAVEDTERADDDGDDLDEDAAPERSAKAMTPSRPRDLN